jgi:predicted nucleotidyltransferase
LSDGTNFFRDEGMKTTIVEPLLVPGYNAAMCSIHEQLVQLLSRYPQFKLAILFGSQATGNVTAASDIDLALLSDTPISNRLKLELVETIGAEFGCPADIVDLHDGPEPILGQILKGKRLLGDNATYARLLTRHVINTADFVPLQQRILTERQDAWIN